MESCIRHAFVANLNRMTNMEVGREEFLLPKAVEAMVGMKRTTIWKREKAGKFPRSIKLDNGTKRYLASEVHAWISDQIKAARAASKISDQTARGA